MQKMMNDNDSKAFLKDMARLYPKYKDNFGAVSNLIVLLMEELQKERKGRKRGEKFEKMWNKFYKEWGEYPIELHNIAEFVDDIKQRHFPKEAKGDGR